MARSSGGEGGINRVHSIVPTSEDWRSVVNDIVWEPPKDDDDSTHPDAEAEEEEGDDRPPEQIRQALQAVTSCLQLTEGVIAGLEGEKRQREGGGQ